MTCHDCKQELVKGAEYMPYAVGEQSFVKCRACHEAEPILRNFQDTEVYSRVVGYVRPVKQWNKGKQAEFGDRKEYAPTESPVIPAKAGIQSACAC